MLSFLPRPLKGAVSLVLVITNIILIFIPFFVIALFKLLIPFPSSRRFFSRILEELVTIWVANNGRWYDLTHNTRWDIQGVDDVSMNEWYFVGSNHRSWADILVLQRIFNRRIPVLKFFIKQELIWVPLMGFAWWALDFPFMKRYSRAYLEKYPEKRGQDLETTRKATRAFRRIPSAVIIFLEGTRFTPTKKARQGSHFRHLLRPKAGGIGYVLSLMGDQIDTLLDVTIAYPEFGDQPVTFWDYLSGRLSDVVVRVEKVKIPAELRSGDYLNDKGYRESIQAWVNALWTRKDELLDELLLGEDTKEKEVS